MPVTNDHILCVRLGSPGEPIAFQLTGTPINCLPTNLGKEGRFMQCSSPARRPSAFVRLLIIPTVRTSVHPQKVAPSVSVRDCLRRMYAPLATRPSGCFTIFAGKAEPLLEPPKKEKNQQQYHYEPDTARPEKEAAAPSIAAND
jgi:hypothetical protein